MKKLFFLFPLSMILLAGCNQQPRTSVVYPRHNWEKSYVSALNQAKQEAAMEQAVQDAGLQVEPDAVIGGNAELVSRTKPSDLVLWGTPPESFGEGITLLDKTARGKMNDALETTPQGSDVRWSLLDINFVFKANSALYEPHFTGGRCRDGVFIIYGRNIQDKKRGLFCQAGTGADWFLLN